MGLAFRYWSHTVDPCRHHKSNTVQVCTPGVGSNSRLAVPLAVVLSLAQIRAPKTVLGTVHELPVTLAVAPETRQCSPQVPLTHSPGDGLKKQMSAC